MHPKVKERRLNHRQLVQKICKTSGYHEYEVKDILNHLVGHIQLFFSDEGEVKIFGLGVIRCAKMKVKNTLRGKKVEYTTHRLSISADIPMKRYLKESHARQSEQNC